MFDFFRDQIERFMIYFGNVAGCNALMLAGGMKYLLCGTAQYGNLVGVSIGFVITASISMV